MGSASRGHSNAGFSLVELMVGMVLGLMLVAGAVSIYLATKRSYVEVEQVAALTESARFAEQIMGDSLRQAGFLGEVTANKVEVDRRFLSRLHRRMTVPTLRGRRYDLLAAGICGDGEQRRQSSGQRRN